MNNKSPKQSALDIVNQFGFSVFPCKQDKSPLTRHEFIDGTTDLYKIEEYWTKYPDALIGVPTVDIRDLFVIDFDNGNGKTGETTFNKLGYDDPDSQSIAPIPEEIKIDLMSNKLLIPEGQRNERLFATSLSLAKSGVSDDAITKATRKLNDYCTITLDNREVDQISNSAKNIHFPYTK